MGEYVSFSPGSLLARHVATDATIVEVIPAVTVPTEVTLIMGGPRVSGVTVDVYHVKSGETPGASNQIVNLAVNVFREIFQAQYPGTGIMLDKGDALHAAVMGSVTTYPVSFYGVTAASGSSNRGR